ncbi:MAG: hypothetical protein ACXV8Q_19600 [Methylobacter sp.]
MSTIASKEDASLGAFSTSKALFHLYETAAPHLSKEQLELMERATEHAKLEADNLSKITEGLGLLISEDEQGWWDDREYTNQLLHQISYNLNAIAGMIELGTSAAYRLKHPEQFAESAVTESS